MKRHLAESLQWSDKMLKKNLYLIWRWFFIDSVFGLESITDNGQRDEREEIKKVVKQQFQQ